MTPWRSEVVTFRLAAWCLWKNASECPPKTHLNWTKIPADYVTHTVLSFAEKHFVNCLRSSCRETWQSVARLTIFNNIVQVILETYCLLHWEDWEIFRSSCTVTLLRTLCCPLGRQSINSQRQSTSTEERKLSNLFQNKAKKYTPEFMKSWRIMNKICHRFSRRLLWRMASSGMLRRVALPRTDISEELSSSIIRVSRIGELGRLTVSSNRPTDASEELSASTIRVTRICELDTILAVTSNRSTDASEKLSASIIRVARIG
jgi:hypothetical protein